MGTKEFYLSLVIALGAIAIALAGLAIVFSRLRAKNQGFGSNTLRAIGAVLFLPTIILLAVTTDFETETLAALLGAVAGYLLSRDGGEAG